MKEDGGDTMKSCTHHMKIHPHKNNKISKTEMGQRHVARISDLKFLKRILNGNPGDKKDKANQKPSG